MRTAIALLLAFFFVNTAVADPRIVQFRYRENAGARQSLGARSATDRTVTPRLAGTSRLHRNGVRSVAPRGRVGGLVSSGSFVTGRDFASYATSWPGLRGALDRAVARRGTDAHWLDLGAGDGNATLDYTRPDRARVTALTYRARARAMRQWRSRMRERSPRSRFLVGSYLDDYSAEEIGQVDVVTDFFGPVSYVRHIDEAIHQIGTLTRENADVFLHVNGFASPDYAGGHDGFVREWLAGSGLDVQSIEISAPDRRGRQNMHIHLRRNGERLRVRALELESFDDGAPPRRAYRFGAGLVGDAAR